MTARKMKLFVLGVVGGCFCCCAGVVLAGQVAMTYDYGTDIRWDPVVPNQVALTVSGPGDFYQQIRAEDGDTLSFSVYGNQGGQLPDGQYRFNLRSYDGAGRPLSQFGSFRVEDGRIEMPLNNTTNLGPEGQ